MPVDCVRYFGQNAVGDETIFVGAQLGFIKTDSLTRVLLGTLILSLSDLRYGFLNGIAGN